jgi:hypothetical protein
MMLVDDCFVLQFIHSEFLDSRYQFIPENNFLLFSGLSALDRFMAIRAARMSCTVMLDTSLQQGRAPCLPSLGSSSMVAPVSGQNPMATMELNAMPAMTREQLHGGARIWAEPHGDHGVECHDHRLGQSSISKGLFVPASQLAFPVEKLKSQKQEQTTNFSAGFWNAEK